MVEYYVDVAKLAAAYPTLIERPERLSQSAIATIRAEHPLVPDDYLTFLAEIGFGSFAGHRLMLYSSPVDAADLLNDPLDTAAGMVLIGDDFAGCHFGFLLGEKGLFEVCSFGEGPEPIAPDFSTFIRRKLAQFVEYLDD